MTATYKEIASSRYYQRLTKLALWPLVGLLALVFMILVSLMLIFYVQYLPALLSPLREIVSAEVIIPLEDGISKIVFTFGVWAFVLFLPGILLIYVIWNVKKLLAELNQLTSQDAD